MCPIGMRLIFYGQRRQAIRGANPMHSIYRNLSPLTGDECEGTQQPLQLIKG